MKRVWMLLITAWAVAAASGCCCDRCCSDGPARSLLGIGHGTCQSAPELAGGCSHCQCAIHGVANEGGMAGDPSYGQPVCRWCGGRGCWFCQNRLFHGLHGRRGAAAADPVGPMTGQVVYPYYTIRGPRDYFDPNPPSIGP